MNKLFDFLSDADAGREILVVMDKSQIKVNASLVIQNHFQYIISIHNPLINSWIPIFWKVIWARLPS